MGRPAAGVAECLGGVLLLSVLLAAIPAGRRPFWSSDEAYADGDDDIDATPD